MRTFDHVGLATEIPQPHERLVERTHVWVTDPQAHPFRVEWLRYLPESDVPDRLRQSPHVAFRVDSIERESAGLAVLLPPFASVAGHRVGFFETPDGAVVELMEY